jgi:succinoglycan biosynthesis protein ExoL
MSDRPLKILYLVHDLADPAVARRITMLRDGGATITLAGFRRTAAPITSVAGCPAINLGQTYNGGFAQRLWSVLRETALLGRHRAAFATADVILARNLEMLAIGVRGRSLSTPAPTLIYESLDIHRLLLNDGFAGKALRALEGWLSRRASALLTSSPAFLREYFDTRSSVRLPTRLIENKVYPAPAAPAPSRTPHAPWVIGWFGAIRCHKSLDLLKTLVRESDGKVQVVIRGRPSLDQFTDFTAQTSDTPGLTFEGPYKNPDDLAAIYAQVHFTWAIDMFEEGLNSSWLLPNRLYEGGLFAAVPIAAENVETGRLIRRLGIGLTLPEPKLLALRQFFNRLTPETYQALEQAARNIPAANWQYTQQDCADLVACLRAFTTQPVPAKAS